jgi:hypothetical protein
LNVADLKGGKNMFQKVKQWFMSRAMKKKAVKEAKKRKKETLKFIKLMKELYNFVKWLNMPKQLPNRAARKAFWMRVKNGEDLVEKQIKRLLANFQENIEKIDKFVKENK